MLFWPRPNMLRFPNRCKILETTAAKGLSCTGVKLHDNKFNEYENMIILNKNLQLF